MRRFTFILVMLGLVAGAMAAGPVAGQRQAQAGLDVSSAQVPGPCTYTPLSFSFQGDMPLEDMRPFTPSPNEGYLQFAPAAPLTTTASSAGNVLMYDALTGTLGGGLSGTFSLDYLNGIAITNSTAGAAARGFLAHSLVITDAVGSMNLLFAVNFVSGSPNAPYYPRSVTGYVQSIDTSGGYAPFRFTGTVNGIMKTQPGNNVRVAMGVQGKLYTGFADASANYAFAGSRGVLPPLRPVQFQTGDVMSHFYYNDLTLNAMEGNFNPTSVFTGMVNSSITGTMELETHSLLAGNSLTLSPGWVVGNFRVTTPSGSFYGPWLSDLPGVAMRGYFFQTGGTGSYANSLVFDELGGAIAYQGGIDIAGGTLGYICSEMVGLPVTVTVTPTSGPTGTPTRTATSSATATNTSTALPTQTPGGPSATPEPTDTATSTWTATAMPTDTSVNTSTVPPTATVADTATAAATATATATATACAMRFEDVTEGSTFYGYVMCLACRGIVSGYACGGEGEPCGPNDDPYFRPGSWVTRGQVAKIVSQAAGFGDPVSGQAFEDVPPGSTFYEFVQRLSDRGVMSGYACGGANEPCGAGNLPYFRPGVTASRGQLAKIVCGADGCEGPAGEQLFEDVVPGSTFYDPIWILAVKRGAVTGYPCGGPGEPCGAGNLPYFRPGSWVTRGQTSKIVSQGLLAGCVTR